jgi:nucleoside-diphosphate-sugar epimerase
MKIFITGATGYIGQKLVARLLNQGHEVHALCRNKPESRLFENPRIKIFRGDLLDKEIIHQATTGCDQVYHIAAFARVWAKNPQTFFDINTQGTVNVLEAALDNGVKKVVFTSTGGTYGISNGKPITEDMVRGIDFFNEYECSKFIAEEQVLRYVQKGLDAVIVHPTRVYGPGVWTESNAVSQLVRRYIMGDWHIIPGNGKAVGNFTYIDDVVDGHLLAMDKGVPGEKYILGGENLDFNSFFNLLKKLSEKSFLLFRVPMPLIMMYGRQEEILAKWFGKAPMVTSKWTIKYKLNAAFSSEKAIRQLGYRITPIETGLARTLRWLQDVEQVYF